MEEKEYEQLVKEDFKNFLYLVWEALKLPEPSRVQYDMADFLQDERPRKMIQAMRGAGKSYITAAFAVWCLYRNPDTTIICISAVQNRAREFIRLSRKIIDTLPFLSHLIPEANDRDGADRFDVGCRTTPDKNPSVAAYGIKSMITGSHADIIVCDDVEIPQNSMTVESRELLLQRVNELESVLNPNGQIIFLGTPQSFDSVYRHLERSYPLRKWTARYPDPDSKQAENLAPMLLDDMASRRVSAGDPTYPEYYSHDTLLEREAIMGSSNFQLQMMLDTTLSDAERFPLLISNLMVHPVSPQGASPRLLWGTLTPSEIESPSVRHNDRFYKALFVENNIKDYNTVIMAIDPSGKGKDKTAVVIMGELNGILHLGHISSYSDGFAPETLKQIADIARYWNVKIILIEENFGGGMFPSLLLPHLFRPTQILPIRSSAQKELRIINTLQPITENHRLCVDPQVARNHDFAYQYSHITHTRGSLKHDDELDAVAIACEYFKERLEIDPTTAAKRKDEREKNEMVKEFLQSFQRTKGSTKDRQVGKGFTSVNRGPSRNLGWGKRCGKYPR